MYLKKSSLLILVVVFLSLNVSAANIIESYQWLDKQKPVDVYSASIGALALKEVNGGKEYFDFLESKKDKEMCWPSGSCKPKETAISTLVFNKEGKEIDQSLSWLKNNQKRSLNGEWLLQIDTQESGDCDVEYIKGTNTIKKKITVEKGFMKSDLCSNPNTKFDLSKCIEPNLLTNINIKFSIKCNFEGKVSSLYNDQGVYYLNNDATSASDSEININNGDFGSYEDTLFVNWALKEVNYNLDSTIYLRKNYKANDVKSNAFLYLITNKPTYLNELNSLQKTDGSFGTITDTAIAVLALKDSQNENQIELAKKWLDSKQEKDGSWNKNIIDTALVLYSVYSNADVDLGNKIQEIEEKDKTNDNTQNICNNDGICNINSGETFLTCKEDCYCGDNKCDDSESTTSCSEDCKEETKENINLCGNSIIDYNEECDIDVDEKCPESCNIETCQCKEEKNRGFVLYIIIFIILAGLLYIAYKKFGNNIFKNLKIKLPVEKPKFDFKLERSEEQKSEFKGPMNPLRSIAKLETGRKSKVEEDLENSLREAKKILEK